MSSQPFASHSSLSVPGFDRRFDDSLFGLPCLALSCGMSRVMIAQQGAQILSWCDATGRERLYLSPETGGAKPDEFTKGDLAPAAIRGGVPICFPQFSVRGPLPKHGFARTALWAIDDISLAHADGSSATFTLRDDERTRSVWAQAFLTRLTVTLESDRLIMSLAVTNNGHATWSFTGALHTYLRVDNIAETAVSGLQNARYQDATADNAIVMERQEAVTINAELDRVYLAPPASLQLLQNGKPSLKIEQSGFADTVVWNPGPILAGSFKDMPDDNWRHMLCVEAACAAAPVLIQPGETWIGSQTLIVEG